mgnify:CR=1 FL=1
MEKNILAAKIKELRMAKGYSQEYLSDAAQLSLRTVQRMENGETVPRGDTLNRLAKALEVSISELTVPEQVTTNNKGYLAIKNLSALIFLVIISFPVLSFVPPLLLWLHKRDQLEEINERGKKILNFQITWCIFIVFYYLFFFMSTFLHILPRFYGMGLGGAEIILISVIIPVGFNVLMVIINTILILTNREMKFWPVYRFLK